MAKSSGRRKTKQTTGKKPAKRQSTARSQGGLKVHGDKLAHAVREAADAPSKRSRS